MSEYLVNGEDLKTVADAIRSKGDIADSLVFPDGMADAVSKIDTKLPEQEKSVEPATSEVVVTPDDGKALSKVTVSPILTETKIITPSTSEQIILPTTGKFISQATVNAVQTETVSVAPSTSSKTITPTSGKFLSQVTVNAISPTKSAATYTPTTYDQTISSGRWLTGDQTIAGDSKLVSSNIRSGVSIFGVTGSYEGDEDLTVRVGDDYVGSRDKTKLSLRIGKGHDVSKLLLLLVVNNYSDTADDCLNGMMYKSANSAWFGDDLTGYFIQMSPDPCYYLDDGVWHFEYTNGYLYIYIDYDGAVFPGGSYYTYVAAFIK